METAVRIELTKDGLSVDRGSTGVIRVAAVNGEEVWPMRLAYWGGQAGFDGAVTVGYAPGVYKLRQAEFIQASDVLMTVYSDGRLFFQSAETGCTGNGAFSNYVGRGINVQLKIEGCNASFGYLNADFEGLSTQESLTPWGYDFSVLNIRVSTPPGATVPAAITFWGSSLY
jgi:hypothetical protein